jgi:hypothetical protein
MKYFLYLLFFATFSQFAIAQDAGTQKWSFSTGGEVFGSPAIGADGTGLFQGLLGEAYLFIRRRIGCTSRQSDNGEGREKRSKSH